MKKGANSAALLEAAVERVQPDFVLSLDTYAKISTGLIARYPVVGIHPGNLREAPDFDPYPWGRVDWVRTLLLNITIAQPLAHDYASRFRGLESHPDTDPARSARRGS